MKKYWEINAATFEESVRIAIKQIQKFIEKRKLTPVELIQWEERSTELAVAITFKDVTESNFVNIADWITQQRRAA